MAKCIMIQGTMSNVGKSLITAGLCRIFYKDGYNVAPFKSQNMALNSFITKNGLEMGRAQVVQAEACNKEPDVRMNPILLKPTSDSGSQVIINGEVFKNMTASEYFSYKNELKPKILDAFNSLSDEHDIIVIEGAGSPAEINLQSVDIVNMGMAKMVNAPVLIVGDIDRGGVFASLFGTFMLQDDEAKSLVKGTIINKFRGDVNILKSGLSMLENLIERPVLGVIPHLNIDIEDEDSLSSRFYEKSAGIIDIAIVKLPKISNFTDFNALSHISNASIRYIDNVNDFKNPDMVIIPGTKSTISDLKWLRESGLEAEILKHSAKGKTIFAICGGYQMLCEHLSDPFNVEGGGSIRGLGLISGETVFEKQKVRTRVSGEILAKDGTLPHIFGAKIEGYEIHMGKTSTNEKNLCKISDGLEEKFDGVCKNNIYGSYVHGIFDSDEMILGIAKSLFNAKGLEYDENAKIDLKAYKEEQFDKLEATLREHLDIDYIYKILNGDV